MSSNLTSDLVNQISGISDRLRHATHTHCNIGLVAQQQAAALPYLGDFLQLLAMHTSIDIQATKAAIEEFEGYLLAVRACGGRHDPQKTLAAGPAMA